MKLDADIAVVGGGPSGLAAAISASLRGFDVMLFEPRVGAIDKACGEGLMPGALQVMDQLGVQRPKGREFYGITYRDAAEEGLVAHGTFPGEPGLGARRTALHEQLLIRADGLGIERVPRRLGALAQYPDRVELGSGHAVRWVIGADGLHSTVRRVSGLDGGKSGKERYGVRRHYELSPWSDRVEVHWSEVGEAYVTPVADDRIGVAMLFQRPDRFGDLLDHFPVLKERLQGALQVTDDAGAGAFGVQSTAVYKHRVLLVGDAAGYVDALTGEGVAIGMVSALEAVDAIASNDLGQYARRYRAATRRWALSTRALLTMTRPRWMHRPLIRLLQRFPALFDRALRLIS